MPLPVVLVLVLLAFLAFFLLWRSGAARSPKAMLLSAFLIAAAFLLRALCLDYQTLDYVNFLSQWVEFYRQAGGFKAMYYPVGNYNIPYLYFLALISYSSLPDLHLIKLLSIFFDVVLSYAAMQVVYKLGGSRAARLGCFFTVLFLPTVVLNGALWGQCDSIYVALAVLSIYLALDDRPILSIAAMALSFGFKLQAIFIMPVMLILWMRKRYKLWHFFLFPVFYIILVLPAVLMGRPFMDTLLLYAGQTGSIGSGLNYNSPSIFAAITDVQNTELASTLAIIIAFIFMGLVLLICYVNRSHLSDKAMLAAAVLLAVGIPFLLPHMHDRYFFAADVLTVALAFCSGSYFLAPVLCQFASLLGYHAYLKMRYLLPMRYGSSALLIVLVMVFILFLYELRKENNMKIQIQP